MDIEPERIVRRDFPRSADGYDRAAVDAHLEAIAAGLEAGRPAELAPAEQVLAAGRVLLGQISGLRVELKNLSAALREQGVAISDALEELLDLGAGPDDPSGPPAPEVGPATVPASGAGGLVRPPLAGPGPETVPASGAGGSLVRPPMADPGPEALPATVPASAEAVAAAAAVVEDARLVALDMALGGRSRAEIEAELARFDLPDRAGLVDAVLSAIG